MEQQNHGHHESHVSHHKKKSMTEKIRTNPWIMSTFVLGILAIILIIASVTGGITGKTISEDKAADLVLGFVESQVGGEAELVDVNLESGLYKVTILFQGSEIPLYVTKDGKSLVQGVLPLSALEPEESEPVINKIPKADVPKVELFVMTHCPYGTQAEKGFIPAILALGDTIDASIKFVHYYLHEGEKQEPYETPIQVCLREEQSDLFLPYLKCFLEDGDSDRCIIETGIDKSKLDSCVQNNADDYYALDSALSEGYGVRGSPTLVVNGEIIQTDETGSNYVFNDVVIPYGRDASTYQDIICSLFNVPPELCGELDLDSASPSPGFGYDTTTGIATAQC